MKLAGKAAAVAGEGVRWAKLEAGHGQQGEQLKHWG